MAEIKVVDWLVTSKCMLECLYCFQPPIEGKGNAEGDKTIMEQIKESDVEAVSLTGGEPLIRKDIGNIARELYESGKRLILFTNAILWKERIKDLQPYLSYVRLSLEGTNQEINQVLKGSPEQMRKTIEFLDYSSTDFEPTVYVGTVINKINKNDIENIAHIIGRYSQVKKWAISKFIPRGKGLNNSEKLYITDSEFLDAVSKIRESFPNLDIVPVNSERRDRAYALILPDLNVVTPYGNEYMNIGNLREKSLKDILKSPILDLEKVAIRGSCYK